MRRWQIGMIVFGIFLLFFWGADRVYAKETKEDDVAAGQEEEYENTMLEKIGIEKIQEFLNDSDEFKDVSFLDLVLSIMEDNGEFDKEDIGAWLKNALCREFLENKSLLIQVLLISIAFGILKNFTELFDNAYVSELCFIMVYAVLVILLMKSFLIMNTLTKDTLENTIEFMQTLIPVYCMSMAFSNGTTTAAGFYELTFLIIYLVQWVILFVLVPLVQIMVMFEFMNHLMDGEKFSKMTELLEEGIRFALKLISSVVIGLNVIQSLIQPAADKLKGSVLSKTASAIPGIGNSIRAVSEIIVGTGTLVKNSVGVAAMLLLFGICFLPVLKMGVMAFFYKLSAALVEPIADKRISGTMDGVCRGSILLAKIMLTSVLLFLITIAMITASTSFIH